MAQAEQEMLNDTQSSSQVKLVEEVTVRGIWKLQSSERDREPRNASFDSWGLIDEGRSQVTSRKFIVASAI